MRGIRDEAELELLSEVELLNGMLGDGLSLVVEPGSIRRAVTGRRGLGRGVVPAVRRPGIVVLVLTDECGARRQVSRRLRLAPGRRPLLLALSACLAECAMDLGLGASVCRQRFGE